MNYDNSLIGRFLLGTPRDKTQVLVRVFAIMHDKKMVRAREEMGREWIIPFINIERKLWKII